MTWAIIDNYTIDTTDRHFIYKHNKNTNPVKYLMTYDLEPIHMSFKANCGYLYIF